MQFGGVIGDANRSFQFTLFNRLCIPASYPPGHLFGVAEEKIFQLKRNKGNYRPFFQTYTTGDLSQ